MNVLLIILEKNLKKLNGEELKPLQGTEQSHVFYLVGTGMEEHGYGDGIAALHIYLKITFASLITNGAIQWVIGQQELHHSLSLK